MPPEQTGVTSMLRQPPGIGSVGAHGAGAARAPPVLDPQLLGRLESVGPLGVPQAERSARATSEVSARRLMDPKGIVKRDGVRKFNNSLRE